jgi:hypothetical protein
VLRLLLVALLEGCAHLDAPGSGAPSASIAAWSVPKVATAGSEFWLQVRIVPKVTLQNASVSIDVPPADFRVIGPATFELGTIAPSEAPPPSRPPALPMSVVRAFRVLEVQ